MLHLGDMCEREAKYSRFVYTDTYVLPLVWISWANSNLNINTIEPLVIEKLMQVLTVIMQNTASSNNIAGVLNILV